MRHQLDWMHQMRWMFIRDLEATYQLWVGHNTTRLNTLYCNVNTILGKTMIHSVERYIQFGANDIYLEVEKSIQTSYPLEPMHHLRNIYVFFEPLRAACCWLSCNEVSRKPQGIITKNLIAIPFVTRIKSSLCSYAHSRVFLNALNAVRNVSASAHKSQEPHSLVWYWTGVAGLLVKTIWVTYKLRWYISGS